MYTGCKRVRLNMSTPEQEVRGHPQRFIAVSLQRINRFKALKPRRTSWAVETQFVPVERISGKTALKQRFNASKHR